MTRNLNETIGESTVDTLIYDGTHPMDGKVVEVSVASAGKKGALARGQLLDQAEGSYSVHAKDGTANAIVAEETEYNADDTTISVPVYISGTFRKSALISDVELSASDMENLRNVGIFVK